MLINPSSIFRIMSLVAFVACALVICFGLQQSFFPNLGINKPEEVSVSLHQFEGLVLEANHISTDYVTNESFFDIRDFGKDSVLVYHNWGSSLMVEAWQLHPLTPKGFRYANMKFTPAWPRTYVIGNVTHRGNGLILTPRHGLAGIWIAVVIFSIISIMVGFLFRGYAR